MLNRHQVQYKIRDDRLLKLKAKTVDDAMMESNYINVNAEFNEIVTDKLYFEENNMH